MALEDGLERVLQERLIQEPSYYDAIIYNSVPAHCANKTAGWGGF